MTRNIIDSVILVAIAYLATLIFFERERHIPLDRELARHNSSLGEFEIADPEKIYVGFGAQVGDSPIRVREKAN
jgi:hypothetical protein